MWAAGVNFNQAVGDASIKVSLGHRSREQSDAAMEDIDKDNEDMTVEEDDRMADDAMMGHDEDTFTNVGLQVGFGAFQFNAAYARRDKGQYKSMRTATVAIPVPSDNADAKMVKAGGTAPCDQSNVVIEGESGGGAANAKQSFAEDESGQWDVWGVNATYTDGPMAFSLGHMVHETEADIERTATMFSASYTLGPGVAWKSSVFAVEDDTDSKKDMPQEGAAFVTGIALSF